MKFFETILKVIEHEMATPTNYGWFHLMFIGIVIITTILLCIFFKDKEDKVIKIESLKDNDIIRKHLLSTEWFVITEKQFLLYKKIAKALAINQNYYWSSMSGAYCDEIVMFFSLLNYINQY